MDGLPGYDNWKLATPPYYDVEPIDDCDWCQVYYAGPAEDDEIEDDDPRCTECGCWPCQCEGFDLQGETA